jgi:hypothetical protein
MRGAARFSLTSLVALLVACSPDGATWNLKAKMEAQLSAGAAGKALVERFPDDFRAAVEKLTAVEADPGLTRLQKDQIAYEESRSLRARHAHYVSNAAPEILLTVLQHQYDDTLLVLEEFGPETCSRYIMKGRDALPRVSDAVAASIERSGELNMLVMAEGRDNPVSREEISAADEELISKALTDRGWTREGMIAALSGDEACRMVLDYTSTIIGLPGYEGDRIRAAVVRTIVTPK